MLDFNHEPKQSPTRDSVDGEDRLPSQIQVARFLIVNGRVGTLLACPLFCVLKFFSVPGFRFRWMGVLSFWLVCFMLWMAGRVVVNRWINRVILDTLTDVENDQERQK